MQCGHYGNSYLADKLWMMTIHEYDRQNCHCALQHRCTIKITGCLTSTLCDKIDDMLLSSSL